LVALPFTAGAHHEWLARALALDGDIAKARSVYIDLLALWKNADPDLALVNKARAESAKLQ
jgi:eukaryotic-like serine/threonine-protein kinase